MISQAAADAMRAVLDDAWVLDEPEDIATYSYDGFLPEFTPDAILVPENAGQIAQIMKIANRDKINIIPRGPAPISVAARWRGRAASSWPFTA